MNNYSPSPQFEQDLRAVLVPPGMRPQFAAELRQRLAAAAKARPAAQHPRFNRAWATALIVLALLIATVLAIGPQRVLAQVLEWLRYVPGIGFVDSENGLRVLAEPASQTVDGITITIEDGLIDSETTWLTIFYEGIRQDQRPGSEDSPGCFQSPQILLPDGSILSMELGEGAGGPSSMREKTSYPALPADVNEVTVIVHCVPDVAPGAGPEELEFVVRFVPAPENYDALPVIPLTTQTEAESTEVSVPAPHGIRLVAENLVELEDGYLIQGSLSWEESDIAEVSFYEYLFRLTDANGADVRYEPVSTFLSMEEGTRSVPWTLRLSRKDYASPITVTLDTLTYPKYLENSPQTAFLFDFGQSPQDGQVWQIDQDILIDGNPIHIVEAEFKDNLDGDYWITFRMQADPAIFEGIYLFDGDNASSSFSSNGGSQPGSGEYFSGLGYDYLPQGEHQIHLQTISYWLRGPWTAQVELPASSADQPTRTPEAAACVTEDSWQALLSQPTADLPESFANTRLLVQGPAQEGVFFPTLNLISPDGEGLQVVGPGGRSAISPDGNEVVYEYQVIRVFDVETGQSRALLNNDYAYQPIWSPDGSQIAYIVGGDGIYLIDRDGGAAQRVNGSTAEMVAILGWMPAGGKLVVSTLNEEGALAQLIDLGNGNVSTLFEMDNKNGIGLLSPDGTRIALLSEVFGNMQSGVYVSNLDGSQKQLIAEPGSFIFTLGAWSSDGDWLVINPYDVISLEPELQHPLAVNVETCEVIVLEQLTGNVTDFH